MNIKLKITLLFLSFASFDCAHPIKENSKRTIKPQLVIKKRRANALTGGMFLQTLQNKSNTTRELLIYQQAILGNFPNFLKKPKKILLKTKLKSGKWLYGSITVMRDYFSIGTDKNFVRVPMTPITAQKIADKLGFILPTTKIVDEIYRQSEIKLSPSPLPPGPTMTSTFYFAKHNSIVEKQLKSEKYRLLTSGHKKDIVITNRLIRLPNRVAIYGWHRKSGKPIQPLSLVHGNTYADYSHGVRFIWNIMEVGGKKYYIKDVLKHPTWSALISHEGPIRKYRAINENNISMRLGTDSLTYQYIPLSH
ncbi:MAG: hypothetical protein R3B45_08405 [Bdellovibrionota bacterium]